MTDPPHIGRSALCITCIMLTIVAFSLIRCYARTQQARDIDPMVGQRRKRCANVNPTLDQYCNNNDSCQFKSFCQNSTTMGTQ